MRLLTLIKVRHMSSLRFDHMLIYYVAMTDAFEKADTIHRDISVGNILLVKHSDDGPRTGYLIDWELSCKTDKKLRRKHERTVSYEYNLSLSYAAISPLYNRVLGHLCHTDSFLISHFYTILRMTWSQ